MPFVSSIKIGVYLTIIPRARGRYSFEKRRANARNVSTLISLLCSLSISVDKIKHSFLLSHRLSRPQLPSSVLSLTCLNCFKPHHVHIMAVINTPWHGYASGPFYKSTAPHKKNPKENQKKKGKKGNYTPYRKTTLWITH